MRVPSFALFLLTAGASCLAHASSFTYNVNDTFTTFSVVGTITTNSNSGVLGTSNITDWTLTLNDGSKTLLLNSSNSQEMVVGDSLTATASALLFDFGSSAGNQLIFQRPYIMYGTNDLCYQDLGGGCDATEGSHEAIMIKKDAEAVEPMSGPQQIATIGSAVTPEPASVALLGTGLLSSALLGFMGRLRRRLPV